MKKINLNIYCDGGSRGNPGPSACAFVILQNMKVVNKFSKYLGIKTNNEAEYLAVVYALEFILKSKYDKNTWIKFYLDSQLVTKQMKGEYRVKSDNIKVFFNKAMALKNKIPANISFNFVKREKNKIADHLLNIELDNNK